MSKTVNADFFQFSQPTGKFTVGRQDLYLVDRNRKESYTPASDDYRELMATIWYPSDAAVNRSEPYAPDYLMTAIKGYLQPFEGINTSDLAEIDLIRIPVLSNAPISSRQTLFPLIIFSHGYYGSRFYCSSLCTELASHGYIVIAPDHTYDAGITELPGNRMAYWKSLTDEPITSDEFYDTFNTRINVRVSDFRFMLDCVAQQTEELFSCINLDQVGIFGHSLGAEAGLQAAADDERIQAVAAMDVFPVGRSLLGRRSVPCMSLTAELTDWAKIECSETVHKHIAQRTKELQTICSHHVQLKDADHVTFSDFALLSYMNVFKKLPQNSMFSIGSIDGFDAITMIRKYLVAFFDKELKNKDA